MTSLDDVSQQGARRDVITELLRLLASAGCVASVGRRVLQAIAGPESDAEIDARHSATTSLYKQTASSRRTRSTSDTTHVQNTFRLAEYILSVHTCSAHFAMRLSNKQHCGPAENKAEE